MVLLFAFIVIFQRGERKRISPDFLSQLLNQKKKGNYFFTFNSMIGIGTPDVGSGTGLPGSLISYPKEVVAGTTMLLFGITCQFSGDEANSQFETCDWKPDSGGSEPMTKIIEFTNNTVQSVSLWAIVNPTVDNGDIVIHFTNSTSVCADHVFMINLTGSFYTVAATTGESGVQSVSNPSVIYTVVGAAGVVFDLAMGNDSCEVGAGQTIIFDNINKTVYRGGASYEEHTGSDPTLSYSTGAGGGVYAGAEIIESFAPAPKTATII